MPLHAAPTSPKFSTGLIDPEKGWRPDGGASFRTFFIGKCCHVFAGVYRKWLRQRARRMGLEDIDELFEDKVPVARDRPEQAAIINVQIEHYFEGCEGELEVAIATLNTLEVSNPGIANMLGVTEKVVEYRLLLRAALACLDPVAEVHPVSQMSPESTARIVVAGRVVFTAERRVEAAALLQRAAETFQQDEGNLAYVFSEDLVEPGVFHLFEEWESEAAFAAHVAAPATNKVLAEAIELGAIDARTSRYDIAGSRPELGGEPAAG